jgi:hypothetical protein
MRFAIIWTWLEPNDKDMLVRLQVPKQRVGYFTTLAEAQAEFEQLSFGEKELVAVLDTRGDCTKREEC